MILLHSGELAAAQAELGAYMDGQHFRAEADTMDKVGRGLFLITPLPLGTQTPQRSGLASECHIWPRECHNFTAILPSYRTWPLF